MTYCRVRPPRSLGHLVHSFSYWEGGEPSTERMVVAASRALSLQIDLHDDELCWYERDSVHPLKGVTVAGPQSRSFAVDAWQRRIVRVVFKPGGARPFLGISPGELRDTHVSLADIWGDGAERLQQRLMAATGPAAVFRTLADALITAAASEDCSVRPAVAHAVAIARDEPDVSVAELAERAEIGAKRLIRLFSDDVGLTPKLYLRIARFERLLANVYDLPSVDWASAAVEHGYFDQSHLIHDFHDFAGMTPAAYFARRGPADHHAKA